MFHIRVCMWTCEILNDIAVELLKSFCNQFWKFLFSVSTFPHSYRRTASVLRWRFGFRIETNRSTFRTVYRKNSKISKIFLVHFYLEYSDKFKWIFCSSIQENSREKRQSSACNWLFTSCSSILMLFYDLMRAFKKLICAHICVV